MSAPYRPIFGILAVIFHPVLISFIRFIISSHILTISQLSASIFLYDFYEAQSLPYSLLLAAP